MTAFAFLHASHSPALLRRIERPALPTDGLRALGRALARTQMLEGIHLLVLGRVREDVIPQVADMGLQAEGAEWAIAVGIVGATSCSRCATSDYVRAAGDVVRAVVEGLGVGGGHRSMAKGIIPLAQLPGRGFGDTRLRPRSTRCLVRRVSSRAIHGRGRARRSRDQLRERLLPIRLLVEDREKAIPRRTSNASPERHAQRAELRSQHRDARWIGMPTEQLARAGRRAADAGRRVLPRAARTAAMPRFSRP